MTTEEWEAALAAEKERAEKARERADDHDSARQSEKERADYADSEVARLRAENEMLKAPGGYTRLLNAESEVARLNRENAALTREAAAWHSRAGELNVEVTRLKALVEDCEREHPPEPEYLAWQQAGKPDVGEVSRLREVLTETREALRACLAYIPGSEVRSWPPGFELREKALRLTKEALARAAGEEGGSDAAG